MSHLSNVTEASEPRKIPPKEPWEDHVAGSISLVLCVVGLVPYIVVLITILKTKQLIREPFYKIIMSVGVADCTGLFVNILLAIHTISRGGFPRSVVNIINDISDMVWYILMWHNILLAFNRFCGVVWIKKHKKIFGGNKVYLWISATVACALITWFPMLYYYGAFYYDEEQWSIVLSGDLSEDVTLFFTLWDPTIISTLAVVSILLYGSILIAVRQSHKRVSQSEIPIENRASGPTEVEQRIAEERRKAEQEFMKRQIKMAIQAGIVSLMGFSAVMIYSFFGASNDNRWISFIFAGSVFFINHAANPFIYLTFNSLLRGKVLKFLGCAN